MKELPVALSRQAIDDLDKIKFYILEITSSLDLTERHINRVLDFIGKIGWVPNGGFQIKRYKTMHRRRTFERSVVIVYQVHSRRVLVKRIFWARQDLADFRR